MDKRQAIFRREVLEHVSAQQLRKATSFLDLDVGDRRFRENHVEALAKEEDFGAVLDCIKMADLMNAVRGLELVPEGRSKAIVIKCLLASAPPETSPVSPKTAGLASNRADGGASLPRREHKTATMKLAQLEEDIGGRLGSAGV